LIQNSTIDKTKDLSSSIFVPSGFSGANISGGIDLDYRRFEAYVCGQFRRNSVRTIGELSYDAHNKFVDDRDS